MKIQKNSANKISFFTLTLTLLCIHFSASAMEQRCGEGPIVEEYNERIRIRPQGIVSTDTDNLQWAVNNVIPGGTIELCEGEFYLGEGNERRTVTITQGVKLTGVKIDGEWLTTIKGGGSAYGLIPDPYIGPFLIDSANDSNAVIFEHIWLRDWLSEAIFIESCNGFQLLESKVTHPVVSGYGYPFGYTNFIHAILARNSESTGEMIVTDSYADLTWQYGLKPHDTNFVTAFGLPATAFTKIEVSRNTIISNDEAIELTANNAGIPSEVIIEDNDITVDFDIEGNWPLHFALFIAGNENTDVVSIKNNNLTLSNTSRAGILDAMGAMILTGENFDVVNNRFHFNDFDGKAIQIGNLGNLLLVDFGSSLYNSAFSDNQFSGEMTDIGIDFTGLLSNRSRGNLFLLGDSLSDVTPNRTIDTFGTRACNNIFEGELGNTRGNLNRRCR
ncbi:hypothetical protein [Marinibactrum halimedae]|uniref:Right-handed parallel beta-helix repeat-containing protein n=1 Tax=Marinibactrum halimedae TaxID=1444977 RepID=A0AA37T145_9GAMM|nr:hypothetical protein [Marinibactrum halimedae]MCD9460663.1 hypothetical protein [Marinibactrum halimedae]GLS24308.1 hypothetical protein GCM10007877_00190 [Marinibactrum halimedae]